MRILLANMAKMVEDTGGLAKVTSAFANEMQRRGHTVSLVYSDEKSGDFYYPLNPGIPAYDVCLFNGRRIGFPLYLKAKRELLRMFSKQKARTVNNDFAERYLLQNLKHTVETVNPDVIVSFQPAASKLLGRLFPHLSQKGNPVSGQKRGMPGAAAVLCAAHP